MASLYRFSDVSEEQLNAHIQKVVSEKTNIATKYDIKMFKGMKKNEFEVYKFHSFTRLGSDIASI